MSISRILISQPAPSSEQKSPFAQLKDSCGVDVDFRSFISVQGVTIQEYISQRVNVLSCTAVIFTSRLLIDNFFRLMGESRVVVPDTMKYFCISEAIALYLQKYIVYRKRKIFHPAQGANVTALMDLILKHNSENYFLPLSQPYKPELPMAMECAALKFNKVVLANTVFQELDDLDVAHYDIVALYSPMEVQNFKSSFIARGYNGRLAVFGEATARAALAEGYKVDIMAPTDKFQSMAAVIGAYCLAEKKGEDLTSFGVETLSDDSQNELYRMAEKRKVKSKKTITNTIVKNKVFSRSATPRSVSIAASKTVVKTPKKK